MIKRVAVLSALLAGCEQAPDQPELLTYTLQPLCLFWCNGTIVDDSSQIEIGKGDSIAGGVVE